MADSSAEWDELVEGFRAAQEAHVEALAPARQVLAEDRNPTDEEVDALWAAEDAWERVEEARRLLDDFLKAHGLK
jgi:hypothetical protein